jgi:hypothetical protein
MAHGVPAPATREDEFAIEFAVHPDHHGMSVYTLGLHTLGLPELFMAPDDQEWRDRLLDADAGGWWAVMVAQGLVKLGQQLLIFREPRFIPAQRFETEGRSAYFRVLAPQPTVDGPMRTLLPPQASSVCLVQVTDWLP